MNTQPNSTTVNAWARLLRLQAQLLGQVHAALKLAGLPPLNWYDVLLELNRAGDEGLRQYEIGEQVLLPKYNLSRLIDKLESEALVERHTCAEDGRGNLVRITSAGNELLKKMWPVYSAVIHEQFELRLSSDEITLLGEILHKLKLPPTDKE
ncbi:MarR family winged helix-turn-helix transcriptional regulator [Nitrincola sp. MINF-07-Sa-05]|uniref:MarR family winged helix-turn-helix transcriptional regulator n=1 Tax=Nitrincola salilacus TaxID=3400273 RepID=UPI003917FAA4